MSRGPRKYGTTDGMADHPLYSTWNLMLERCYNEGYRDYHYYGGHGIIVCPAWHSLRTYIDWCLSQGWVKGDGLTTDRRDNDGSYWPENCWRATRKEQANNRRSPRTCNLPSNEKWKKTKADDQLELDRILQRVTEETQQNNRRIRENNNTGYVGIWWG